MRRRELIASLGSILAVWPLSAPGQTEKPQTWPAHPVKLIVGFAPHAKLAAMAYAPIGTTPRECAEFFQSEMAKWGPVIKEAGLKAD